MNKSQTNKWRYSQRQPRLGPLDATAAIPLLIFIVHIRIWTGILACVAIFVLYLAEQYGLRPINALKRLRVVFTQGKRPARMIRQTHRLKDFGTYYE